MPFFQSINVAKKSMHLRALTGGVFALCLFTSSAAWSNESAASVVDSVTPPSATVPAATSKLQHLSNRASELAMEAMGLLGIEYQYGGNTPEEGLDCSGFVHYIFSEAWGKILPRTSRELSREGKHIDKQHLQTGDLVFFNTLKRKFSHVGIYLGDNKFIHAPSSGNVVRIESMDVSYWKKRFNGGRRISASE